MNGEPRSPSSRSAVEWELQNVHTNAPCEDGGNSRLIWLDRVLGDPGRVCPLHFGAVGSIGSIVLHMVTQLPPTCTPSSTGGSKGGPHRTTGPCS